MQSILFVFTSADKTLSGKPTGWYLPEAAHPYYVLEPHFNIDFASPKGPNPPIDQSSIKPYEKDEECVKFLNDAIVQSKLTTMKKLVDVDEKDYCAVFYVGGHGPIMDLASDPVNARLASQFYQKGKVTAAVCHGVGALVGATDANGKSIFVGKPFTGFSNVEEEQVNMVQELPFLLEDKIRSVGGRYEKNELPWGPKVVVDGIVITGQNPASASPLGHALLKSLKH